MMASKSANPSEWAFHVTGKTDEPEKDQIILVREAGKQIRLEIAAPNLRSAEVDQIQLARQEIQAALVALQAALNSPTALPGLHPN
jgi:hypothetical protein